MSLIGYDHRPYPDLSPPRCALPETPQRVHREKGMGKQSEQRNDTGTQVNPLLRADLGVAASANMLFLPEVFVSRSQDIRKANKVPEAWLSR